MKRIKEDIKENVDPLGYAQRPKRACREKIVTFKESSDEEEEMLDENNNVVKQVRLKKESVESDSSEILDELKSESDSESERVEKQDKKDKVEPSKAIKVTLAPTNVAIDANDQNANCVNDFRELLLSLKTPKTSAKCGLAADLPVDTQLDITKFGLIDLPISNDKADQLFTFIQPKPRKGVSASYDSYQLMPKKFKIKNENWEHKLNEFVNKLCAELEWRCPVKLQLEFLTFSRPCDGNVSRKAYSLNCKNSLGTLILELPSVYTGGSISIDHGQFDSPCTTEPSIHFFAHLSSMNHKIDNLRSGCRFLLFYSILQDDQILMGRMSQCLLQLKNSNKVMGYDLEHSYTKSSQRRFHELDFWRSNLIKDANALLEANDQFAIYILSIQAIRTFTDFSGYELLYHRRNFRRISYYRMREEADENCAWKETNRTFNLNFYELHGTESGINAKLKQQIDPGFISTIVRSNRNIDLNNFKEYSHVKTFVDGERNQDIKKLITYEKQLLVIWPKAKELDIKIALNPWIGINHLSDRSVDDEYLRILSLTLNSINGNNTEMVIGKVNSLFRAIKSSQSSDMFHKFLTLDFGDAAKSVFDFINTRENQEFAKELAQLIIHHGYLNLKEHLRKFFEQNFSFDLMCRTIQALFEIQSDVAFNCLEDNLLEHVDFAKLRDFDSGKLFIETMFQFEQDEKFTNIIEKFIRQLNSLNEKDTIARFMVDLSTLISIDKLERYFRDVYRDLFEHLKQKIAEFDEFTWCMPNAAFPKSKKIEIFLRSNNQSVDIKSINFKSLNEAREFANMHAGQRSTYSVTITAQGRGNTSFLSLNKTRAYFDLKRFHLKETRKTQKAIEDILSKFQS